MQAIWMLAAAFFFAVMSAFLKAAAPYFDPLELVCYRGAIGIVILGVLMRTRHVGYKSRYPWMHVWRNVIGVSAMTAWFFAVAHLPIATATTLESTSSVWIAVLLVGAALFARRHGVLRQQAPLIVAVLVGFVGVVLLLAPEGRSDQLAPGLIGLAGGAMSALAYVQIAALGRVGEPDTRTVFYYSIGCTLAGLGGMAVFGAHPLDQPAALWLLPMGIFGALGQLCMTRAFTHGATIVVANLQYSDILFGALLGVIFFDDHIAWLGWAGIAIIALSGIVSTTLRGRAQTPQQTDENEGVAHVHPSHLRGAAASAAGQRQTARGL